MRSDYFKNRIDQWLTKRSDTLIKIFPIQSLQVLRMHKHQIRLSGGR